MITTEYFNIQDPNLVSIEGHRPCQVIWYYKWLMSPVLQLVTPAEPTVSVQRAQVTIYCY